MAGKITANDLRNVSALITRQMVNLGLINEGETLVIESGSATYGRAWKVFVTGGKYGTAWHETPFGSLYSGSARELYGKLVSVSGAFGAVRNVQVEA